MQDHRRSCERRRRRIAVPREWRSFGQIIRGAIGQCPVRLSPDIFGGVEFGRVGREEVDVQPGMACEEVLDVAAPMDGPAIPEQIHGAREMAQQVAQKGFDVQAREIAGAAVEIERDLTPPGRHGHPTADREAIVAIPVPQRGGLPPRRPGPPDIGDEQEAALINEHEVGPPAIGVFLSGARRFASTARWPARPAPRPVARVSDSSSRGRSGVSRHAPDDSERRSAGGSPRPLGATSRDRCDTRPATARGPAASRAAASGPLTSARGGPGWLRAQPPDPRARVRLPPAMHRTHRGGKLPRHRRQRMPGLDLRDGPTSPLLQLLGCAGWSHASYAVTRPPRIFHSLCKAK